MSIESYLYANYKKVEKLPGGGYYCTSKNGDNLYVPANYNGNMGMLSYLPGSGGSGNDAAQLRKQISSSNPPQYIIAISAECSDHNYTLQNTYNGLTSQGITITDVAEMSFSASGGVGFDRLEAFQAAHPEVSCRMIVNNSSSDGNRVYNPQKFPSLVENKVPIIYVDPQSKGDVKDKTLKGGANGFNVYWLQSSSSGHVAFNADIIHNNFVGYILGYTDNFTSENVTGGAISYRLVTLDPTTGQLIVADYDDLVSSSVNGVKIPNLAKLKAYDGFDITETKVENDTMGTLNNLKDLRLTSPRGKVSSDYYYVQTSMNNVRNQVKSSNYLTSLKQQNYRSSEGIPGCIAKYVNAYFDVVNELLTTLSIEAESVLSYAQAMVDMDDDQAAGAEKLGTIKEIEYSDTPKPESTYVPPKTGDVYNKNNQDNKDSGTPSGGCGSHGGCGSSGTPSEEPGIEREIKYKFEDGHFAIIKYEGAKISEFKYQYKYATNSEAVKAYPDIFVKYKKEDYVDKLLLDYDHIDIIIKPEAYNTLEFKEIEKKFLEGAEVQYD